MAAPRAARRLAAILAADVVGYSRLMGQDEQGTLERLKAHRKEFVEPLVAEHRGRIVNLAGDSALCEFASVVEAVACAVAIQDGHGRARAGPARGRAHPVPDRGQRRRRDRRGRGHLRRRGQRRRPAGRPWPSQAVSASPARCTTRSAASSTSASRTWASSRSRTSPGRSAPGAWPMPRPRRRGGWPASRSPTRVDPEQRRSATVRPKASSSTWRASAGESRRRARPCRTARRPVAEHNLPQPNPSFVGRTAELAGAAARAGNAHRPQRHHSARRRSAGWAAIGKTQLALAYAYAHLGDYDLIRWLRAEEPAALAADYAGLAPALGLDPRRPTRRR